jgi:ABC-type multidrug transport system ATPase subunit
VAVEISGVCTWVKVVPVGKGARGWGSLPCHPRRRLQREAAKEKQILFDITGSAWPGEVVGLLGLSGSGKTTLLSLLGGRSLNRTTGNIYFNGGSLTKSIKRRMGFVAQVWKWHVR